MTRCSVLGISVYGPGLELWQQSIGVLSGKTSWSESSVSPPAPTMLAANERRRSGLPARLALAVCGEAVTMAGMSASEIAAVFASSNGDGATVHNLLETLADADGQVSPTQFHNSVHNAVAGYWSIAAGSQQPITCLGCNDWTFAAALLQAFAETNAEMRPTLLCVYDAPLPAPLDKARHTAFPFAAAIVLSPLVQVGSLGTLSVSYEAAPSMNEAHPSEPAIRDLPDGNAAARSLRLLEALASGRQDSFQHALLDGRIDVAVNQ